MRGWPSDAIHGDGLREGGEAAAFRRGGLGPCGDPRATERSSLERLTRPARRAESYSGPPDPQGHAQKTTLKTTNDHWALSLGVRRFAVGRNHVVKHVLHVVVFFEALEQSVDVGFLILIQFLVVERDAVESRLDDLDAQLF